MQLLREAKRRGLRPEYVLFDSWYAAASLLHQLESMGWKYVARLKSNRLFEGQAVRERWPHRFGRARGRLRKVNHKAVVVKDGRRYFVTNDTGLISSELKRHYRVRQQIEEVFRLLKQEFGWGGSSAQGQSTDSSSAFGTLCSVPNATSSNQEWTNDLCFQTEVISSAHS